MAFAQMLHNTIERKQTLLCIGLDSDPDRLPAHLKNEADPILTFNRAIIEATADLAAAFKINTAFYESLGSQGWETLQATFASLPADTIKIADAKRGDIGNTSQQYASAFFHQLNADALTVNPYMGFDSVAPFLQDPEKGVFFLCLTSNPGAQDFQYFSNSKQRLYERIAAAVQKWNNKENCGLVVGATHPDELGGVRAIAPDLPFLIPGIGAQGGDLEQAVLQGTDRYGGAAIFNSSRAILYASNGRDFAEAARRTAEATRHALERAREKKLSGNC
ncbi:MAG TPA: orotidine-5'-phosphate decarboxylase [bacterium]|nr:orotidine-5'-phosphate decarboxylase [bacterium]HPG45022.1 orotidine-5'-phosphate decarboxylase [bacterium]HPM97264.1 orotidine-5'-phosphate decarboxylase [bacterium]